MNSRLDWLVLSDYYSIYVTNAPLLHIRIPKMHQNKTANTKVLTVFFLVTPTVLISDIFHAPYFCMNSLQKLYKRHFLLLIYVYSGLNMAIQSRTRVHKSGEMAFDFEFLKSDFILSNVDVEKGKSERAAIMILCASDKISSFNNSNE